MPYRVTATAVSRPVPDQLRLDYKLESVTGGVPTLVDTGSVTFTMPDPTSVPGGMSAAQRIATIRHWFKQAVRNRIQAMTVADTDFAAVQAAVAAGQVVVTEAD